MSHETKTDKYIEQCLSEGLEIIYPNEHELFIDIDSEEDYQRFKDSFEKLSWNINAKIKRDTPSKSGLPNRHIVVEMPYYLNPLERIALQAILGSDPKRELLSYISLKDDAETPTIFAEKRDKQ